MLRVPCAVRKSGRAAVTVSDGSDFSNHPICPLQDCEGAPWTRAGRKEVPRSEEAGSGTSFSHFGVCAERLGEGRWAHCHRNLSSVSPGTGRGGLTDFDLEGVGKVAGEADSAVARVTCEGGGLSTETPGRCPVGSREPPAALGWNLFLPLSLCAHQQKGRGCPAHKAP